MTLNEAIEHAENKAEELYEHIESKSVYGDLKKTDKAYDTCLECAKEHEQLAKWLRELRRLQSLECHVDMYEIENKDAVFLFSYHEMCELVTITIIRQIAGDKQWIREYAMEKSMSHTSFKLWCDNWFELEMSER